MVEMPHDEDRLGLKYLCTCNSLYLKSKLNDSVIASRNVPISYLVSQIITGNTYGKTVTFSGNSVTFFSASHLNTHLDSFDFLLGWL